MAHYSGHNDAQLRAAYAAQLAALDAQHGLYATECGRLERKPRGATEFDAEKVRNAPMRTAVDAAKAASREIQAIQGEWWLRHPSWPDVFGLSAAERRAYMSQLEPRVGGAAPDIRGRR